MGTDRDAGSRALARLRQRRGWSWTQLAGELRTHARDLGVTRIAEAQAASIKRTIGRWEAGTTVPDDQYQLLLAVAYSRTPLGALALGPGSDLAELLDALAHLGIERSRRDELAASIASAVTETGTNLLAFLGGPIAEDLGRALSRPDQVEHGTLDGLASVTEAINQQVGTVPFVRLHLAQAAVVDSCRRLLAGQQAPAVRGHLRQVASSAYALAARLAFETHDDGAALALYDEAVAAADPGEPSRRAAIRSSQTMVVFYATGEVGRARSIANAAVQDARRGPSVLMRARAHALQAEMAARGEQPQPRHVQVALHLAWHDLDGDLAGDPMPGAFSKERLRGFEGVCGIAIGEAEKAERQLAHSAAALTRPRESVQRAIALTDMARARLRTGAAGAAESAAEELHACVDLTASTRGRVPAQRLRQARLELRPWRTETFVADLDDHIHSALIGI